MIEKQFGIERFYFEIVVNPKVLEGIRHARAHVARVVLFARDSRSMHFFVHVEKENVDFAKVFTNRMGPPGYGGYRPARMWPAWYYLIRILATCTC